MTSTMIPCSNPSICRVKSHLPGTQSECMKGKAASSKFSAKEVSRRSATPALAISRPPESDRETIKGRIDEALGEGAYMQIVNEDHNKRLESYTQSISFINGEPSLQEGKYSTPSGDFHINVQDGYYAYDQEARDNGLEGSLAIRPFNYNNPDEPRAIFISTSNSWENQTHDYMVPDGMDPEEVPGFLDGGDYGVFVDPDHVTEAIEFFKSAGLNK